VALRPRAEVPLSWPPTLLELKDDLGIAETDTRDDARLETVLAAAIAYVERVKKGQLNFTGELLSELPTPTSDHELGTIRMAGRWHTRRRSPDGLIDRGELGAARIPNFDSDIEQLLEIGRYGGSVVA
jgi:hypothetical protein